MDKSRCTANCPWRNKFRIPVCCCCLHQPRASLGHRLTAVHATSPDTAPAVHARTTSLETRSFSASFVVSYVKKLTAE